MNVYVYGCTTCGVNSVLIRRLRKLNDDVQVINTKYDEEARKEHIAYLQEAGFDMDSMKPIIVENGKVRGLRS